MYKTKLIFILVLLGALVLSACGSSEAEGTPTLSMDQMQTAAVSTYQAGQTQTALALPPTASPTATFTPLATLTPLGASQPIGSLPTNTAPAVAATASCNKLLFISDVTIPDNTSMTPGQTFTKTWRVQNTGSCAWAAGYKFSLIAGDAMSGQALTLSASVAPGANQDLSIAMSAPTKAGKYTGTWRMSDAAGAYFGDAVYVVIVVGGTTGTPATATLSVTATPVTPTAYP